MKTPVTESKPTTSGMVCSNNERDSVRLQGYWLQPSLHSASNTPSNCSEWDQLKIIQDKLCVKVRKKLCRKMYFNFILLKKWWNEFGKIEFLKLLLAADNNKLMFTVPQVLPMLIIPVLPYPCKTDCPLVSPACNPFNSVMAAPEPGTGRHGSPLWGHGTSPRQDK